MANGEQLNVLLQGATVWNKWRKDNPEDKIDLRGAHLRGAYLTGADLTGADLTGAYLYGAYLPWVDLSGADLRMANLSAADLTGAYLRMAKLGGADLSMADLRGADLAGANLSATDLSGAVLIRTNLERAVLTGCKVYGISAWSLKLDGAKQNDLVITPYSQPIITVDNLEVAQFIYLLLHNEKIRDVINTVANKAVLILGRFTPERKVVLDALRTELRHRGYIPILFDFEKPSARDFTETIKILAGMSLFVIADISNPKSSPLELQATVPDYMVPFVPIIQEGEEPFSMFRDLHIKYKKWVLAPLKYDSLDNLISVLDKAIINPALEVHNEILVEKAAELPQRHVRDYK